MSVEICGGCFAAGEHEQAPEDVAHLEHRLVLLYALLVDVVVAGDLSGGRLLDQVLNVRKFLSITDFEDEGSQLILRGLIFGNTYPDEFVLRYIPMIRRAEGRHIVTPIDAILHNRPVPFRAQPLRQR